MTENVTGSVLQLSGDLTIVNITNTHEIIADAISRCTPVALEIEVASEVDISFVQLIEAARQSSARSGVALTLSSPAAGQLADTLERGGFLGRTGDASTRFWQSGH